VREKLRLAKALLRIAKLGLSVAAAFKTTPLRTHCSRIRGF
jgi:hypothetical protein